MIFFNGTAPLLVDVDVITKNVTRVGTPGTDGAYVQYNTTDTDYGNSPNTLFENGTPNSFHYLSFYI